MDLVLDNRRVVFEAPRDLAETLDRRTAFYVKGFMFVEAFKRGHWDGREHLVKRWQPKKAPGWYTVPIGLLGEVLAVARAKGVEFVVHDERRRPSPVPIDVDWNPEIELRDYQETAVAAVLQDRGLETGKVLLDMATRSGKTVVAAGVIGQLRVRTLFLVQSQMLLEQTVDVFRNTLRTEIGVVGRGVWDPRPVTVASVQTLTRRAEQEECRDLLNSFDLVFCDEVHHLSGEVWRDLLLGIDAFWKVGLSATIFLHKKKENPKGTIWIRAAIGPIAFSVTPSELIERGYLVPPRVVVHRIEEPQTPGDEWHALYEAGIVHHPTRNAKIVELAQLRSSEGHPVVVVVARHDHVHLLDHAMTEAGLRVGVVIGPTPMDERRRLVQAFERREIDVLLGTVIGEGVDMPAVSSVIVAEGGESPIRAVQRFRNITPAPGKDTAVLDDFADKHNRTLAKHSLARFKIYRSHAGFTVAAETGARVTEEATDAAQG